MNNMKPWIINWAINQNKTPAPAEENNAKIDSVLDSTQSAHTLISKSIEELPQLDATGVKDLYYLCSDFLKLKKINGGIINTGSSLSIGGMFSGCKSLTDAPVMPDVTKAESMASMFDGCTSLVNVPVYNIPRVGTNSGAMTNAFRNCPNLSNESLNNILATCISATRMSSGKVLETLGLSSEQIKVCKTLSNYQAFLDAGWKANL